MKNTQTLSAMFSFPGFLTRSRLQGVFGDAHATAGHRGSAKKTAVCSGRRNRYRTVYDRRTRRVRDPDAAG